MRSALAGLSLVLGLGLASLGALDLASGNESKVNSLVRKANGAAQVHRWEEAERLYRKAKELRPDSAELLERHAAALAHLGRAEDAIEALAQAASLGYATPAEPEQDEVFDPLRAHPRFAAAISAMERNLEEAKARASAANAPLPSAEAPSFDSLAALRKYFEQEERRAPEAPDWASSQIQDRSLRMRRIAALERYANEHPQASDRTDAALEALRAWARRTGFTLPWQPDLARDLSARASAFGQAHATEPELRSEARFYEVASRVCAGTSQARGALGSPPEGKTCESAFDELAALAEDGTAGLWATRAAALQALCLRAARPEDREGFLTARARWTAAGAIWDEEEQPLRLLDGTLNSATVAESLQFLGPPEFSLISSEGKTVTLQSLRGKVVLLNFWSPG